MTKQYWEDLWGDGTGGTALGAHGGQTKLKKFSGFGERGAEEAESGPAARVV